jgi:uncharacterized protein (DUF2141 family)
MNITIPAFLLLVSSALSLTSLHQDSQQKHDTILLTVVGLDNNIGDVKVGLFNSAESFTGKTKDKFGGAIIKIQNKKAQYVFPNVPYGEYAIKLFHDENGNDEIDTNFLGIPTESYGFSNNAKALFGPPSFEKAKFIVSSDTVRVEIDVD